MRRLHGADRRQAEYSCSREAATVKARASPPSRGLSGTGGLHPLQQALLDGRPASAAIACPESDLGRGSACGQSKAEPRRYYRRARSAPLPLRHPQSRHPARCKRPPPSPPERGRDLQHPAAKPDRQPDPVAMDRVRGEGPRPVCSGKVEIGQGILTALTQIAAEELDVRPSRSISSPARPTSARPRASPRAAIRSRSAAHPFVLCAPRCARCSSTASPRRCAARERAFHRGRQVPARRQRDRPRLLVDGGRHRARTARQRHAPTKRPSTYKIVGKHLPRLDLRPRSWARVSSTTSRRRTPARPRAAPALARRASCRARRECRPQGGPNADRDFARGEFTASPPTARSR